MGADLYIRRISDETSREWTPKFQAAIAFRDSLPDTHSPVYETAQKLVGECWDMMYSEEGYFRDSYNDSSVLWKMGLSWWSDVTPLLNKPPKELNEREREQWYVRHPANLDPQKLLDLIRPKMRSFKTRMKKLPGTHPPKTSMDPGYTYTKEDADYYLDRAEKLITFLETAVKNGDRIYASI